MSLEIFMQHLGFLCGIPCVVPRVVPLMAGFLGASPWPPGAGTNVIPGTSLIPRQSPALGGTTQGQLSKSQGENELVSIRKPSLVISAGRHSLGIIGGRSSDPMILVAFRRGTADSKDSLNIGVAGRLDPWKKGCLMIPRECLPAVAARFQSATHDSTQGSRMETS